MKRILMALLLATLVFTGCGSSGTAQPSANEGGISDADFEKVGYLNENSMGDSAYFYIVTNNSRTIVDIEGEAAALDKDGKELGTDKKYIDVLAPGETSIMQFYFDDVTGIDKVDCQLTYAEEHTYQPVIADIKTEDTVSDQHLTVRATNEGKLTAQFVEVYALFFDKDNNVISYDSTYITDSNSEIKPGVTISAQLDAYTDFDHVEYYLAGRADGTSVESSSEVSDKDFTVKEYLCESSSDTSCFLAITNNSDKTVGIDANLTAFNAKGEAIGADDGSLDVIGPGEESVMTFYLDGVKDVDKVEYTMNYDTTLSYKSGLQDLEVSHSVNDRDVEVTVTNKGAEASEFVEAYVLFLDADGKVVLQESGYITDNDNELKPGATLSEEFSAYKEFDSVVVYMTARRDAGAQQ